MSEFKLRYEDRFKITGRGDTITVRWKDNNCREIKKGDSITQLIRERDNQVDNQLYEVRGVELFKKSFDIIGDNMGILIKPKSDDTYCHYSDLPSPMAYETKNK